MLCMREIIGEGNKTSELNMSRAENTLPLTESERVVAQKQQYWTHRWSSPSPNAARPIQTLCLIGAEENRIISKLDAFGSGMDKSQTWKSGLE